jgi:hypothetical protein
LNLTEDQILSLAPDESSRKSGKDLANPSKWVSKGINEQALWGECQGSGSKPYQTQVDISNVAFKCSCPSRKFPCKHGLGLLLLYSRTKKDFTNNTSPEWVNEWISKRLQKEEKKATAATTEEKPVDEAAQAKRQLARQQKVADGMEELRLWIKDIVRNGILDMPSKEFAWFENMGKRMVDAQAPGLAGMVRALGETNFYEEGWQSIFLDQLLSIYLVTEGYKNSPAVDPALQQDIRSMVGFVQNQDEIKEQTGITDTWLVLAKHLTEVDQLTTERNWLYGTKSNQYALVLQFIVRGTAVPLTFSPGMYVQAELVFFPSVSPIRALVKRQMATNSESAFTPFTNWQQVAESETQLNSRFPVRGERPYIVQELTPVQYNNQWWLQDASHNMMQLKNEQKYIWKLLSLSGGNALNMAIIGREHRYEPVGVWYNEMYIAL